MGRRTSGNDHVFDSMQQVGSVCGAGGSEVALRVCGVLESTGLRRRWERRRKHSLGEHRR